jgi:predicted lipoprotein with Yx(FWY)xxD motif
VHWGITDRLRQVVVRDKATTGRRLPEGHAVTSYGFFTDGETPQAAIDAIAPRWPALRFRLVARPQD